MKKAVLLLYNVEVSEIVRYEDMLSGYRIVQIVAPLGWGLNNKDAGFVDGGQDIGCLISDDIDYHNEFDVVMLLTVMEEKMLNQVYTVYLKRAVENGKQILCNRKIGNILINTHTECKTHIVVIDENAECKLKRMGKIDTPIIVVAGTHEYTQKFKIQLELKRYLDSIGYKVALIGSKDYSKLFGCLNFPEFMFQNISERNKILAFHEFIRDVEKSVAPDVIIIGVPGGMMPYNDKFPGYFGITLYEVLLAIRPDAFILSCLFERYDNKYFEEVKNMAKYRFGVDVDCFNVSPFQVDINESNQNDALQYFKLSQDMVQDMLRGIENDAPIFNIANGSDGKRLAEFVTKRLEEYSDAEFV